MERQWKQVQGVIDVTSYGGETKQYHVEVDPYRLRGHGVTLEPARPAPSRTPTRTSAASASSWASRATTCAASASGSRQRRPRHRGHRRRRAEGHARSASQDIADVNIGHAPRLGIVGYDDEPDVVQGIVLMRYGGETPPTLEGIHERLDYIRENHILPPGMDIEPYYDRGDLVKLTTHTVMENLLVGMVPRRARAAALPGPRARRAHHGAQHPARAAHRLLRARGHAHVGEPHLAGRGRLRHRRRLDRHHDGEHLPPPRRRTEKGRWSSASSRARARSRRR